MATEKDKVKVMGIDTGDGDLKAIDTKFIKYAYNIDYEKCYKNNFGNNVERAIRFYLSSEDGAFYSGSISSESNEVLYIAEATGFVLYPQALNPFLKIMETLKLHDKIIILPAYNQDEGINLPAYLIIRVPDGYPIQIVTKNI